VIDGDLATRIRAQIESGRYCAFVPAAEDVVACLDNRAFALMDKVALSRRAREVGLVVPEDLVFQGPSELADHVADLPYPGVVKPAHRSFRPFRLDDPSGLERVVLPEGEIVVQPFITGPMSAVAGVMWGSEVHSSTFERWHRIWPLDCGLATWAVTIPRAESLEEALGALMGGYSGLFVAQFVGGHLIDLNLRVHSSLPLAVKAGANLVSIYADLVRGLSPTPSHAEPGHTYRWVSGDVKGMISSVRSGTMRVPEAIRALTPVPGTVHSMVSLRDPLPMVARLAARLPGHA
jgi:hypothetical protein